MVWRTKKECTSRNVPLLLSIARDTGRNSSRQHKEKWMTTSHVCITCCLITMAQAHGCCVKVNEMWNIRFHTWNALTQHPVSDLPRRDCAHMCMNLAITAVESGVVSSARQFSTLCCAVYRSQSSSQSCL